MIINNINMNNINIIITIIINNSKRGLGLGLEVTSRQTNRCYKLGAACLRAKRLPFTPENSLGSLHLKLQIIMLECT